MFKDINANDKRDNHLKEKTNNLLKELNASMAILQIIQTKIESGDDDAESSLKELGICREEIRRKLMEFNIGMSESAKELERLGVKPAKLSEQALGMKSASLGLTPAPIFQSEMENKSVTINTTGISVSTAPPQSDHSSSQIASQDQILHISNADENIQTNQEASMVKPKKEEMIMEDKPGPSKPDGRMIGEKSEPIPSRTLSYEKEKKQYSILLDKNSKNPGEVQLNIVKYVNHSNETGNAYTDQILITTEASPAPKSSVVSGQTQPAPARCPILVIMRKEYKEGKQKNKKEKEQEQQVFSFILKPQETVLELFVEPIYNRKEDCPPYHLLLLVKVRGENNLVMYSLYSVNIITKKYRQVLKSVLVPEREFKYLCKVITNKDRMVIYFRNEINSLTVVNTPNASDWYTHSKEYNSSIPFLAQDEVLLDASTDISNLSKEISANQTTFLLCILTRLTRNAKSKYKITVLHTFLVDKYVKTVQYELYTIDKKDIEGIDLKKVMVIGDIGRIHLYGVFVEGQKQPHWALLDFRFQEKLDSLCQIEPEEVTSRPIRKEELRRWDTSSIEQKLIKELCIGKEYIDKKELWVQGYYDKKNKLYNTLVCFTGAKIISRIICSSDSLYIDHAQIPIPEVKTLHQSLFEGVTDLSVNLLSRDNMISFIIGKAQSCKLIYEDK